LIYQGYLETFMTSNGIPKKESEKSQVLFRFREDKATQVAVLFLKLGGNKMSYLKLIKLMYLVEREALIRWGRPITYDRCVAMSRGPVLSRILNLLRDETQTNSSWKRAISPPSKNYEVELREDPGDGKLSNAEDQLIEEIFNEHRAKNQWELSEFTHGLGEWKDKDPKGSSIEISYKDILQAGKKTEEDIESILGEIKSLKSKDVRHYLIGLIKDSNTEKIANLIKSNFLKFLNVEDFREVWDKFKIELLELFKKAVKIVRDDYQKFAFPVNYTRFLKQIVSKLLQKCGKKEIEFLIWFKLYHYLEEEDLSGLSEDLLVKFIKNYYYIASHSEIYEDPWEIIKIFRDKIGIRISQPIKKLIRVFVKTGNYDEIIKIKINRWLDLLSKDDLFELLGDRQLGLLKCILESIKQLRYEYHGFGLQVDESIFNYFQIALPSPEAKALKNIQSLMPEQLILDYGYHDEMFHAYEVKNNHVVRLWLGYSNISHLPESIGDLIFLKELDLTHCNLSSLPESIGNLQNLIELELFGNKLKSLPESIKNLNSLKCLNAGGNPSLIPSLIMNPYNFPSKVVFNDELEFISNTALLKIVNYKTPGGEKTWREKFRVILEKNRLGNYTGDIMKAIKRRIIIDKLYVGDEYSGNVGFSKLGGNPDLPSEFEWPYWKERPLSFLMQLNLEDLEDYEYSQFYSHKGFLYFFFDPLQEEWGINYPKNREAWRVIYYEVDKSALTRTLNPSSNKKYVYPTCYLNFLPDIHLPTQAIHLFYFMKGDEFNWDELNDFDRNYSEIHSKIFNYNHVEDNHALFGYADMIQEGPFFTKSIHLLQLGDDRHLNWRWGGGGRLHFYINESDLKKNNFNDVNMVLDCL
ncbi:hypothetical protein LCGC14_1017180, partial [marine sediment metagenome]